MKTMREEMLDVTVKLGYTEEEAEIIVDRISYRLGGYSHEEAVEKYPMPEGSDKE